jgi:hypothetical protein
MGVHLIGLRDAWNTRFPLAACKDGFSAAHKRLQAIKMKFYVQL